jgi:hypothetical protein
MVCAELLLEPVLGPLLGNFHDPGVVDQDVELVVGLLEEGFGKGANGGKRVEI